MFQVNLNNSPLYIILGDSSCISKRPKKGLLSVDSFYSYLEKIHQEQEFISKLDFKQEKFRNALFHKFSCVNRFKKNMHDAYFM